MNIATLVVKIVGDINDYTDKLKKSQQETDTFSNRAVNGLSEIGGTLVMGALIGAATATLAIGTASWTAAETMDKAYDTIQTQTGATGATLRDLQTDFDNVYKNVPTDAQTAADVISALNQKLGQTGPSLEADAIKLINLTNLLGGDAKTNAELFGRAMQDAGVPLDESGVLLDKLFVASQQSGIGVDSLMQKMVQFGAPMRNMGFDLDTSIALFAKWEKEGVNAELVMGSLRIAAGKFAEAGKPLNEGLQETIDKIKGAKDSSEALTIAQGVFGAKAAGDMAAAIREGRFDIEDMTEALKNSDGAINDTTASTEDWNEKWVKFTNSMTLSLAPMGQVLRDIAGEAMDMLGAFLSKPETQKFIDDTSAKVVEMGGVVREWLPKVGPWFKEGFDWLDQNRGVIVAALAMIGVAILAFAYTSLAASIPAVIAFTVAWWPVIVVLALVGLAAYLLYQAWSTNFGGIQDKFAEFMVKWNEGIAGWQSFGDGFKVKWDEGIKGWTGFFIGIGREWDKFKVKWDEGIAGWQAFGAGFKVKWDEGIAGWKAFFIGIGGVWDSFWVKWDEGIAGWKAFGDGFKEKWDEGITGWSTFFTGVKGKWDEFKLKWDEGIAGWKSFLGGFKEKWDEGIAGWKAFFAGLKAPLDTFLAAVQNVLDWVNQLIDGIGDIVLPELMPGTSAELANIESGGLGFRKPPTGGSVGAAINTAGGSNVQGSAGAPLVLNNYGTIKLEVNDGKVDTQSLLRQLRGA